MNKLILLVLLLLGSISCSEGDDDTDSNTSSDSDTDGDTDSDSDTDTDSDSDTDSDGDGDLEGCQLAENWECSDPVEGYEHTCVAYCGDSWAIACNQDYDGGICQVSTSDICDAPPVLEGCDICYAAIEGPCAEYITP